MEIKVNKVELMAFIDALHKMHGHIQYLSINMTVYGNPNVWERLDVFAKQFFDTEKELKQFVEELEKENYFD